MKLSYLFYLFSILIFFVSCDLESGIYGIVLDKSTGERIEGVQVNFEAQNGETRSGLTDINGYYDLLKYSSCGIKKCLKIWTMTFTKDSFKTEIISDNYYFSPESQWVNPDTKDSLVIEMDRI